MSTGNQNDATQISPFRSKLTLAGWRLSFVLDAVCHWQFSQLSATTLDGWLVVFFSSKKMASKELKIVFVGDGAVRKTAFLETYMARKFPYDYVPTV